MAFHFFNFYGYETQDGWTGREEQLKDAGYDTSAVEDIFGKGLSDDGTYPSVEGQGTFMSANEQLAAVNSKLDINKYELAYGEGYVEKPYPPVNVHYNTTKVTVLAADMPVGYGEPTYLYLEDGDDSTGVVAQNSFTQNQSGDYEATLLDEVTIDTTKNYVMVCDSINLFRVIWIAD